MKIGVIGSGVIGYVTSTYLTEKGHNVDCISPTLQTAQSFINKKDIKEKIYNKVVSPKYKRRDFKKSKSISDAFLKKDTENFLALEIIDEIGLARYWGANLAINGMKKEINSLCLYDYEKNFINKIIPKTDVQKFYKEYWNKIDFSVYKSFENKEKFIDDFQLFSSILAIFKDTCQINNLPDDRKNISTFGSFFITPSQYKKIDGYVDFINFGDPKVKPKLSIRTSNGYFINEYDYVIVTCGAIGSYRLISKSINLKNKESIFSRLRHHPIIAVPCFVPKIKYPNKYIAMSNFDVRLKTKYAEVYLNFFPLLGALKAYLRKENYSSFEKALIKLIKNLNFFIRKLPDFPIFPNWWINRIYISSIYLPSKLTSTYMGFENNKIKIQGDYRSDFEKTVFKKLIPSIFFKLIREGIIPLTLNSKIIENGADYHYSSSLESLTNKEARLKISNKTYSRIIINDSSSSNFLPIANPTYYFICRAIKLLRSVK